MYGASPPPPQKTREYIIIGPYLSCLQYPEAGVIYQDITADNGNIVGDQYVFETAMPMVMTRKYTNLYVGTCDSKYIEAFTISPSTAGTCKDRYCVPAVCCIWTHVFNAHILLFSLDPTILPLAYATLALV